ncbi:hypothetical protein BXZ70DRAFT_926478 [Cristinia sonorae]|uniref:Uncharacterized protein n=1 Tax=Cristinia sonorae TaxID=1940300 RepID=A0A8K0UVP6_9AGAR|nr:hypothetical protein BXZ70DRAFT_926478 [Cristinia sonorae]
MSIEAAVDQEGWVQVEEDWWRSPYEDVPWSYQRQFLWSLDGIKYAKHPLPPHYHDTLFNVKNEDAGDADAAELVLNTDLVGVKGAEDTMKRYELDVGILSKPSFLDLRSTREPLLFRDNLCEDETFATQSRWDDQVRILFGDAFRRSHLDGSYDWEFNQKVWNLDENVDSPSRTSTSPDVVDLTDSELSADSEPLPSTPNADRKSYAQVVFVERPGQSYQDKTVIAPSPAKPLNASALSFIPATNTPSEVPSRESSESPYTSPTYEFHFPSLTANPPSARTTTRSLPPNLEKDEQGFYIQIPSPPSASISNDSTRTATPKRPSASLLPAFLAEASANARNRHTSKTRAIVDRLRSSATSTTSDPPRRSKKADVTSPRRTAEDSVVIKDNEVDIFVDPMSKLSNIDGWISSVANEAAADEAAAKARQPIKAKSHKRSGSSISSVTPTTPSSSSSSAPTTFSSPTSTTGLRLPVPSPTNPQFPTVPHPYYAFTAPYGTSGYRAPVYPGVGPNQAQAQYFQMQYQMQLQAQAQWQLQLQANARMQAGITQAYPMFQPAVPVPPQPSAVATSNTLSRAKPVPYTEPKRITVPITGVAGIRHA